MLNIIDFPTQSLLAARGSQQQQKQQHSIQF